MIEIDTMDDTLREKIHALVEALSIHVADYVDRRVEEMIEDLKRPDLTD